MLKTKLPWIVLAAALIVCVIQMAMFGPKLPDPVASHFAANGQANGSISRTTFIIFTIGFQFGLAALLVGTAWLTGVLPTSMINIPNREYWLSDERRQESLDYQKRMLLWITAITTVFFVFVTQLVIHSNMYQQPMHMAVFWVVMGIYLVAIFAICGRMILRFQKIPLA